MVSILTSAVEFYLSRRLFALDNNKLFSRDLGKRLFALDAHLRSSLINTSDACLKETVSTRQSTFARTHVQSIHHLRKRHSAIDILLRGDRFLSTFNHEQLIVLWTVGHFLQRDRFSSLRFVLISGQLVSTEWSCPQFAYGMCRKLLKDTS